MLVSTPLRAFGGSLKIRKSKRWLKLFLKPPVEHMFDYIKPTIKHHPEEIILHLGTNELKKSDSRQVA